MRSATEQDLKRWQEMLEKDGVNSKERVREEIKKVREDK